jgi:transcriptional regulator with XRE-family HTH domain
VQNAETRGPVEPGAVREIREGLGLSRERLAVMAGRSVTTVYLAERGIASDRTLAAIANALVRYSETSGDGP